MRYINSLSRFLGITIVLFLASAQVYAQSNLKVELAAINHRISYRQDPVHGDNVPNGVEIQYEDIREIIGTPEYVIEEIQRLFQRQTLSIPLEVQLTVDRFQRFLRDRELYADYYEVLPPQPGTAPGSLAKPPETTMPASNRDLRPEKQYLLKIYRKDYDSAEVHFQVIHADNHESPLMRFEESSIVLEPEVISFLIDASHARTQSGVREYIGRGLDGKRWLKWLQEYNSLEEFKARLRQAYQDAPPMFSQNDRISLAIPDYYVKISEETSSQGLSLQNSAQYAGQRNGRAWYNWQVYLNASADILARVESVTYNLHPSFQRNVITIRDPQNRFALSSNGWGEFEIRAVLRFRNGEEMTLMHWLELF